ncbi:MAG TPA: 2'-5' RNA ligase family protein [Bacilli bacterium]|nr:2'-5' RNA ligase family protein [Bacilli bacterium]
MLFFIGLVPPDEFGEQLDVLHRRWNYRTIAAPHITVKAQSGLTPDMDWVEKVRSVCAKISPFTIQLGGPTFFGDSVLYLSVQAPEVRTLHEQLVEAVDPSPEERQRYWETGDHFVPHLTVAQTAFGVSAEQLQAFASEVERELTPSPTFRAQFVRVYMQERPGEDYRPYLDIPLGS